MDLKKVTLWYLLSIPIVAGISTLEFQTSSGFTFTGLVWAGQAAAGLMILAVGFLSRDFHVQLRSWWPWLAFCGWIWLSLLWREQFSRQSIQEATQLCMPVLVGMIAAAMIHTREDLKRLLRTFGITFVLLALYSILVFGNDDEWARERIRPAALTLALMGCVFMGSFPRRFWLPLSGWGACILLSMLTESRMATLALLVIPVIHPAYQRKLTNVVMATGVASLAMLLFFTPIFQERFFGEGGGGTLSDVVSGQFSGAGRFEAWPYIQERAWEQPLLGWGVGSAFEFVPTVWDDTFYPHNDYLRIFFELGMIGVALFVAAGVWQLVALYLRVNRSKGIVRTAFVACWLGFCVLFISCATDNTILYNIYYTNLLFAVLGGAYGVTWAESHAPERPVDHAPERWRISGLEQASYRGIRFNG